MTNIPTWRERAGLPLDYEVHSPSSVEKALLEEVAALRKANDRYQWLANRVLACDYGDNDAPGQQIGWRIVHDLLPKNGGRQPAFMYGASIDEAINAAFDKQQSKAPRPLPVPRDAKLWSDGIWRDSSGNVLGPAA